MKQEIYQSGFYFMLGLIVGIAIIVVQDTKGLNNNGLTNTIKLFL